MVMENYFEATIIGLTIGLFCVLCCKCGYVERREDILRDNKIFEPYNPNKENFEPNCLGICLVLSFWTLVSLSVFIMS